ncbi:MAG: zinc-ribbon domain-containing protein, partial [Coriobacteriales bacterium]|nr:zinc-ribbon domain-containing protein [Coriobacteriales bacterium]
MYCARCGSPLEDGAWFCAGCGAPVGREGQAPLGQASAPAQGPLPPATPQPVMSPPPVVPQPVASPCVQAPPAKKSRRLPIIIG